MRNSSKGDYVNETLPGFARTAMPLNVSRIRRKRVCKYQEVIGTFRDQSGFVGSIGSLAIVARVGKSNALKNPSTRLNFKDRHAFLLPERCYTRTHIANRDAVFVSGTRRRQHSDSDRKEQ